MQHATPHVQDRQHITNKTKLCFRSITEFTKLQLWRFQWSHLEDRWISVTGDCVGFLLAQDLEKGKQGQRAHVYMEKAGSELLGPVSWWLMGQINECEPWKLAECLTAPTARQEHSRATSALFSPSFSRRVCTWQGLPPPIVALISRILRKEKPYLFPSLSVFSGYLLMAMFFACLPDTIRKEWLFPGLSCSSRHLFGFCGFFVCCSAFIWSSTETGEVSVIVWRSQRAYWVHVLMAWPWHKNRSWVLMCPNMCPWAAGWPHPMATCLEILSKWGNSSYSTRMGS